MRYFLLFLIFAIQISLFCQNNLLEDKLTQKQIITESMIKAAGIQTISGILYLADKWNFYSIDGYERDLSANNLSTFQRQNFIVMIDGQRVDDKVFDVQNINQLPISIDQVDYVVLINTPQIYNGEYTENGLIDIHTKKPEKDLSVQGFMGVGDQTGDPGPYAFTQYQSPNVDKMGYNLAANVNLSTEYWYIKAATKIEQNFATDPEVNDRVSNLFPFYNKAKMTSTYYKLNVNVFGGNQEVMVGNTRHYDFFFFKPYGDEIPVYRYFKHIGLSGLIKPKSNLGIKYSAIYSTNEIGQWENKLNLDFNWQEINYYAKLEGNYNLENLFLTVGAGYRKLTGESPKNLFQKSLELKNLYGRFDYKLSKDFIQSFGLFAVNTGGNSALNGYLKNYWDLGKAGSIRSSYTYSERLFQEDANYWYWNQLGYSLNAQENFAPIIYGNIGTSRLYTADIDYSLKFDSTLSLKSGINYRHFSNYYVESQSYQYYDNQSSFYAPVEIFTNSNLKVFGADAGIEYRVIPNLSQKIYYSYQKDFWGSPLFRDIWHELPVHKITYTINFQPNPDFGIWAKLNYASATTWIDYKYADLQTAERYKMTVLPLFITDLSVQKWFWNRKIWVNVLFRNIFNQSEKYVPIGVSNTLRFYIQLQVYLDSIL